MKVRCIDKGLNLDITKGKIYELVSETEYHFTIIDDSGELNPYKKYRFEIVEVEKEVDETIHKEQSVNEFEMISYMRQIKNCKAYKIDNPESYLMFDEEGILRWYGRYQNNNNPYKICLNPHHRWVVEELPKQLKKMEFGEAIKLYIKWDELTIYDVVSVLTGNNLCTKVEEDGDVLTTDEEIDALLTVKGVYEDDGH